MILFQSTPSQRGRPSFTSSNVPLEYISIHALAKRATNGKIYGDSYKYISIHALAKRATKITVYCNKRKFISIHALAKRATHKGTL